MENLLRQYPFKRWILSGFALTVPTLMFWCTVAYSVFTHDHTYVDAMLSHGGRLSYIMLVAILPVASFVMSIIVRAVLRQQAIARNMWHRDTPEMLVNQRLINWNVLLLSVMIISLINN